MVAMLKILAALVIIMVHVKLPDYATISRWKQMQCQIKVVKCNVGGHFENMAATFEFDGILGGQNFLLDKEGKMYVHTKFHACITICTILVLSRYTKPEGAIIHD